MISIILSVFFITAVTGIIFFNRLIRYKFLMKEAWSGIDVQLKRRHDLIPNILESVCGYEHYERKLFEDITVIRSRVMAADDIRIKAEEEKNLSCALRKVFALVEAYPQLKANQLFLDLQKNLSEIEDQIQLSRRYYNGTVRNYNTCVESFPGIIVASLFNFKQGEFFEIEYATERHVPDIKFNL